MWNTTEPPKDRPIVAVGGIMIEDELSTTKVPFTQLIWWSEEHKDWMLGAPSEPTHLRRSESEEVIIHYWAEMPSDKPKSNLLKYTVIARYHGDEQLCIQDVEIAIDPALDANATADRVNQAAYAAICKLNGWEAPDGLKWEDSDSLEFLCVIGGMCDIVWRHDGF